MAYGIQPDDASADVFVYPRGDTAENTDEPVSERVLEDGGVTEGDGVDWAIVVGAGCRTGGAVAEP